MQTPPNRPHSNAPFFVPLHTIKRFPRICCDHLIKHRTEYAWVSGTTSTGVGVVYTRKSFIASKMQTKISLGSEKCNVLERFENGEITMFQCIRRLKSIGFTNSEVIKEFKQSQICDKSKSYTITDAYNLVELESADSFINLTKKEGGNSLYEKEDKINLFLKNETNDFFEEKINENEKKVQERLTNCYISVAEDIPQHYVKYDQTILFCKGFIFFFSFFSVFFFVQQFFSNERYLKNLRARELVFLYKNSFLNLLADFKEKKVSQEILVKLLILEFDFSKKLAENFVKTL